MNEVVSIVVPVYNTEKYLNRCVFSLVNQTYENIEIILVDDGSSDGSPAICDEWAKKDSRVVVVHQKNAGAGMARNKGIECATGKYLMFVDSDDGILRNTIESCLSHENAYKADVIVYGRPKAIKADEVSVQMFSGKDVTETLLPGLFVYKIGSGISAWGKIFNLDIIKRNNVRFCSERELLSEDAVFVLEYFAYVSNALTIPENYYCYTLSENSLSRTYSHNHSKLNDMFLNKSLEICKLNNYPKAVETSVKARYQIYAIGVMKGLLKLKTSQNDNKKRLWELFRSDVLRSTLTPDVLKLSNRSQRLFWRLMKMRMYSVCCLLLKMKLH